jgi:acetyl esterase
MPLHPVLALMLEAGRLAGRPQLSDGTPADARLLVAAGRQALGAGPAVAAVREVSIATRAGSIPGRLFRPLTPAVGLIVYLHGGGWMIGALDDFDAFARTLAARSGCALLLVDYRLAPEYSFPAGLDDAEDAIRWAAAHCADLAGRSVPLIVAGDSAGANLAIVAALELRGQVKLAIQLLFYPVTDADTDTPSYRAYGTDYFLTQKDMQWFFRHYAGEHPVTDPRIAPLRCNDLNGAPATWIATAEYDVLRDEGEVFAQRLLASGVPVHMHRYMGLSNGFARLMNLVDAADQALSDAAAAISRRCPAA